MVLGCEGLEECGSEWMWVEQGNARRNILPMQGGGEFHGLEMCPSCGKEAISFSWSETEEFI